MEDKNDFYLLKVYPEESIRPMYHVCPAWEYIDVVINNPITTIHLIEYVGSKKECEDRFDSYQPKSSSLTVEENETTNTLCHHQQR